MIEYLDSVQVADRLGLSRCQVNRIAARGGLGAVKFGGVWWFDPEEVRRYAARQTYSEDMS